MFPILLLVLFPRPTTARSPLYGNCSVAANHLDPNTKQFFTDCDSFGCAYMTSSSYLHCRPSAEDSSDCAANGTCLPRLCRRDEYLLSSLLTSTVPIPPLCDTGTFCPDDHSGCLPLVPVGGKCELNRDGGPYSRRPWGELMRRPKMSVRCPCPIWLCRTNGKRTTETEPSACSEAVCASSHLMKTLTEATR